MAGKMAARTMGAGVAFHHGLQDPDRVDKPTAIGTTEGAAIHPVDKSP